jgi:uncharacterized membrane protein
VPVLAAGLAVALLFLATYPLLYPAATAATVAVNTLFFSLLAALLTAGFPQLQRLLLPGRRLQEAALAAARAEFVRQGIHCTRKRTGLLLYLAAFEQRALLVVDSGVAAAIPAAELARLEQAATAIFAGREYVTPLASFFDLLQQTAGRYLPREDDDTNELADGLRS